MTVLQGELSRAPQWDGKEIGSGILSPADPTAITPEWMTQILALHFEGVKVSAVTLVDQIMGTAGKIRVRLKYAAGRRDKTLPETLIVKASFNRLPLAFQALAYHIEVYSYACVVPTLNVNTAKCWYAGIDRTGASVLVLEDLADRHVTFCDVNRPLGYDEAARFLDAFARVHARWWNSAELLSGGKLGFLQEFFDGGLLSARFWVESGLEAGNWERLCARPVAAILPALYRKRDNFVRGIDAVRSVWKRTPFCVAHGDEHLNNLYMEADGTPGMVDWQVRRLPWCYSVSYFIAGALDPLDRKNWEQALLSHYLGKLQHYGAQAPTFDEAWLAYRQSILVPMFIWFITDTGMQADSACIANSTRFSYAAMDHDTLGLLLSRNTRG